MTGASLVSAGQYGHLTLGQGLGLDPLGSSEDLIGDVLTVWPDRTIAMWSEGIVPLLVDLDGVKYATLSVESFGAQMAAAGLPTIKIGRRIDGRPTTRAGLKLATLLAHIRAQRPVVYFAERDGFIKIGTTQSLAGRISALNRGDCAIDGMTVRPVALLAVMPGGREVELAMHELFKDLRYAGEWFLYETPLVDFVAAVAAVGGRS